MLITLIILYFISMLITAGIMIEANGASKFESIITVLASFITLPVIIGIVIGSYLKKTVLGWENDENKDSIKPDNK